MYKVLLLLLLSSVTIIDIDAKLKKNYPPHCTHVTKDTDYVSRFKLDYPVAYIHPGVRETYQPMYCLNPPLVNKAVTVVCDWAAPPQVQFTLDDVYTCTLYGKILPAAIKAMLSSTHTNFAVTTYPTWRLLKTNPALHPTRLKL